MSRFGFRWMSFERLSTRELYEVLALRQRVFSVEQRCIYLDVDGKDPSAHHLLATDAGGALVGYLRVLPPGGHFPVRTIGRVVTAPEARGGGLGHRLVEQAIEHLEREWGPQPVALMAQSHLVGFYAAHGFRVVGQPYDEAGIMHIDMHRDLA